MTDHRLRYFGERWDAPAYDDAIEVDRPTGTACLLCKETIGPEDSGVIMPYVGTEGPDVAAQHLECWLRMGLGSIAHLEGRCSCVTGIHDDEGSEISYREEGRAVKAWALARKGTGTQ